MITGIREGYEKLTEFRAAPNDDELLGIMRGVMLGSFESVERPVVICRHRSWPAELELVESILRRKAKFIMCVRDLPEILASLEKIWRENKALSSLSSFTQGNAIACRTLDGRCNYWVSQDHIVGYAYVSMQDALVRGFRDRMHFVHFDDLTRSPKEVLQGIYKFLEEQPFNHDFENVEQVIFEDDTVHGVKGLHDIRKAVRPVPKRAKELLGPLAEKFRGPYIWDDFLTRVRPQSM
jgi:sulfotransferase